jgi:ABC-type amino acid transport substrate-binding protein
MKKILAAIMAYLVLSFWGLTMADGESKPAIAKLDANEKITVAAFEYPPIYQNADEKGLAGDIVVEAFKAVNIDTEFQFFPPPRMVKAVVEGQTTCGIGGTILFDSPDFSSKVTVSSKIQYVSQVFVYDYRKFSKGLSFNTLADMANYKIGVLLHSGIFKFLEKTKELKIDSNYSHDGSARQLQNGRIDVWAIVDLTGIMYMKKLFPNEADNYKYTKAFNRGDVSVVFSKIQDPNNLYNTKFKQGLAIIKKNGTYMKIMAKYYGGLEKINSEALTDDMK